MQKHQQKETPNLTANIDYILDELAREMQASREKDRHSLLMQKMKDNPNNVPLLFKQGCAPTMRGSSRANDASLSKKSDELVIRAY